MDPDPTENAQSVSSYIRFGKFRVVHMGDLTWNKEMDLMCPNNRLGTADLFIVSHHGQPDFQFAGRSTFTPLLRASPS